MGLHRIFFVLTNLFLSLIVTRAFAGGSEPIDSSALNAVYTFRGVAQVEDGFSPIEECRGRLSILGVTELGRRARNDEYVSIELDCINKKVVARRDGRNRAEILSIAPGSVPQTTRYGDTPEGTVDSPVEASGEIVFTGKGEFSDFSQPGTSKNPYPTRSMLGKVISIDAKIDDSVLKLTGLLVENGRMYGGPAYPMQAPRYPGQSFPSGRTMIPMNSPYGQSQVPSPSAPSRNPDNQ